MYKAKYIKARDRYYESSAKNEELRNELKTVVQDVRELKSEIKMLIHTILGVAPDLEPTFSSDELGEDEGLDQDTQEMPHQFSHREDGLKGGRGETKAGATDRFYLGHQVEGYAHDTGSRSAAVKDASHFHHRNKPVATSTFTHPVHRSSGEPNGRYNQVSRRPYEEDVLLFENESDLHNYDEGPSSPYGAAFRKEQDHGLYYEDHSRPSPSSRHRSSQRSGEPLGHHPHQHSTRPLESRYHSNGNPQLRATAGADRSISPDDRYPNHYASRAYRN